MKGSLKAFELPAEMLDIEEALFELGDAEPPQELRERIERFCAEGPAAIETAFQVVESLNADVETLKAAADALQARRAQKERSRDNMKAMLLTVLDTTFQGKVKLAGLTLWGQDTHSFPLEFESADPAEQRAAVEALPDQFKRVRVEADKTAIKAHIDQTGEVPKGFVVVPHTTRSLRSKRA